MAQQPNRPKMDGARTADPKQEKKTENKQENKQGVKSEGARVTSTIPPIASMTPPIVSRPSNVKTDSAENENKREISSGTVQSATSSTAKINLAKLKADKEKSEKEKIERERLEEVKKETAEKERLEKEQREKAEKEKIASERKHQEVDEEPVMQKSGSGLGWLSLVVALSVGGAGYYYGSEIQTTQQLTQNKLTSASKEIASLKEKQTTISAEIEQTIETKVTNKLSSIRTQLETIAEKNSLDNKTLNEASLAKNEKIIEEGQQKIEQLTQAYVTKSNESTQSLNDLLATATEKNRAAMAQIDEKVTGLLIQLNQNKEQFEIQQEMIAQLKEQLKIQKGNKPTDWTLAEVNYYVQLAFNKIEVERNPLAAMALLNRSKVVLAQQNNPQFNELAKAIAFDLESLSKLNIPDQTQLIETLLNAQQNVSEMAQKKSRFKLTDEEKEQAKLKVTNSITDWRSNINNTLSNFANKFGNYTPPAKEGMLVNDLTPQMIFYVQENIKNGIGLAISAIKDQNDSLYQTMLDNSLKQVRAFYDEENSATKNVIELLETARAQSVKVDYPADFTARKIVEQYLEKSLNQTGQPALNVSQGDE